MIVAAGGAAVAARVDHTVEAEVQALVERIDREHGRLDLLVDSVAGEDPTMQQYGSFWTTDLTQADAVFRRAIVSHIITAKHVAPIMIRDRRGLIVEVTEGDTFAAGGNPLTQTVKLALKGLALNMAAELHPHGVAAVAVTPGFLRSEAMLDRLGVTEETWRDAGRRNPNFLASESPWFVGRAIAALASDPSAIDRSGQLTSSWELARAYGVADRDGSRPDWGAHAIDWSPMPKAFVDVFRVKMRMQLDWLGAVTRRTRELAAKLTAA
jgi:NAD(P)-dependent dehydrogenase (short-subunit alcohol dehydrogenase family)